MGYKIKNRAKFNEKLETAEKVTN